MALDSHLPPLEKNQNFLPSKAHPLECQGRDQSNWVEDFRCMRPLQTTSFIFIECILMWEHPNYRYEYYISRSIVNNGFYYHLFPYNRFRDA